MMSFDVNEEKFREIALPAEIIQASHWITPPLAVVDDLQDDLQVEHLELYKENLALIVWVSYALFG